VIDPYGRTVAQSQFDAVQVLNATVRASHAATPYQRWGDAFAWAVVAAVASVTLRSLLETPVPQQP
jgi:apolipoprotein N-acyltransferase